MEMQYTIEVKNVKKAFRIYYDKGRMLKDKVLFRNRNKFENNNVLKGISFNVKKGEAVGLIGHNGCGKSTTLKLLTKIIYPDEGSINIHGRVSSLLELGAGFHQDLSGRENIYINASIFGLTRREIDERVESIIEFSELGEFIDAPVRTYSSGMYMRLAFSVAINVNADVLLVDEILAVGDANFQKKCLNKMHEIKAKGTTIVIVSHSMEQIYEICDKCIWLNEGLIECIGDTKKVAKQYLSYMNQHLTKSESKESIVVIGGHSNAREEKNVEVVESYLTDANSNQQIVFQTNDTINIHVKYKTTKEIKSILRIEIVRADFILCYANIFDNEKELYNLNTNGEIVFAIKNIPLLASKYYVNIYMENRKGERQAELIAASNFSIINDSSEYGVVNLESHCLVKGVK